jgi:hypothetical protein
MNLTRFRNEQEDRVAGLRVRGKDSRDSIHIRNDCVARAEARGLRCFEKGNEIKL